MRLAITTDWLVAAGGAERVVVEMHALWPEAPIFTTLYKPGCMPFASSEQRKTPAGRSSERSEGWNNEKPLIVTSSLQKWYPFLKDHRLLLPWMPRAVERWDLRGFDVILSSSHAVAKGCIPPSTARHICYCHTPMRYAWEMEEHYLDDFRLKGPLRSIVKRQLQKLRRWDRTTARRVDLFIANSKATQERISRFYGRESIVLHPPVDERFFKIPLSNPNPNPNPYYLAVGRLVPYKRFDLLIELANAEQFPLKIVGSGPDASRLKRMAGKTVEFLGYVPDEILPTLYRDAAAFLYPTYEDAGIALLEAQACGTPVVAFGRGGALDTVIEGETGVLFQKQTLESLRDALKRLASMQFVPEHLREHARKFSSEGFRERLKEIVEKEVLQRRRVPQ